LNQLVNLLSGVSTNKDTLLKYSHATDPVLRVDQLGAGVIQQWLQNGTVKARINNDGSFLIDGSTDISLKANGQIVGYARAVRSVQSGVGNVGAGLDTLDSFDLPAASLATNGDFLEIIYRLSFGVNDNNKRVALSVDGTLKFDTGSLDIDQQGGLLIATVYRESSTLLQMNAAFWGGVVSVDSAAAVSGGVGAHLRISSSQTEAVADLGANAINFLLQAEGASNNDIVLDSVTFKVTQMT
jgi:hypothetical protein